MVFKLSKSEEKTFDKLNTDLSEGLSDLEAARDLYQQEVAAAFEKFQTAVEKFNEVAGEMREFATEIAGRLEEEISEKSERWQESNKGQAANSMKESWEGFVAGLEDFEAEEPQEIETDLDLDGIVETLIREIEV